VAQLGHCATSWKIAGSIPNGVTGIFYWHNPSGRTMALGLTQPLNSRTPLRSCQRWPSADVKGRLWDHSGRSLSLCRLQLSNQMIDFYKTWYARYGTGGYVTSYKYNVSVNNTTLYFIYNKNTILSVRHVSTFIRSSSGPLRKQIQELSIFAVLICYML